MLSRRVKKRKEILKFWLLYLKSTVQLCAWGAAWEKRSQGCGSTVAEREPACAQVARKAKGMLACVSKSGAAGAGQ